MVSVAPTWPPPLESPDTVSEAHGSLNLAPPGQRERHMPASPSEVDEIRRQITVHIGPNPTYVNLLTFLHPSWCFPCYTMRKQCPTTMALATALSPSRLGCTMPRW